MRNHSTAKYLLIWTQDKRTGFKNTYFKTQQWKFHTSKPYIKYDKHDFMIKVNLFHIRYMNVWTGVTWSCRGQLGLFAARISMPVAFPRQREPVLHWNLRTMNAYVSQWGVSMGWFWFIAGIKRAWPASVQVMAWYLMEPCHYPKQCWLIIRESLRIIFQWNFNQNYRKFIQENIVCRVAAFSQGSVR